MHPESMEKMKAFKEQYVNDSDMVLDVGSLDVNGSYRELFESYEGLDIVPGPNVNTVADRHYEWPCYNEWFHVVISGQTFEHVEFPERTMREIYRVLFPDGLCCIIAPSSGPLHDYPADYRRYSVKSMRDLAEGAGLTVISVEQSNNEPWKDVILIARKEQGA